MKKLSRREFTRVSIMLFGLFFGAGNLIFPPLLGKEAAKFTFQSLAFFSITAVIFPILGVIVVAKTKGLTNLATRVDKYFAAAFTAMIYLAIGPGLGIPRAGSLPYEMAIAPYLSPSVPVFTTRLIYTATFFLIAYLICLKPTRLVDRMGKFLTPSLIGLIVLMFIGLLAKNPNSIGQAAKSYADQPAVMGFLGGYNTMDTIAALNFGLVISLAIRSFNISDERSVITYTVRAGLLAGSGLLIIYAILAYIGASTSGLFLDTKNGAEILSLASQYVFGNFGIILLALIFTLACLTTCIGLITSISQYFTDLSKGRISYKLWITIWSSLSFFVANFGLNTILKISVPVLTAIYPVSLVLILLGLTENIFKYSSFGYKLTCYVTLFISFVEALYKSGIGLGFISSAVSNLPFYKLSLAWLIPMLLCWIVAIGQSFFKESNLKTDFNI